MADVAIPPSPSFGADAIAPVPATVVIIPLPVVTFRMRNPDWSEIYMFPSESNVTL